jgi:hypothetical protein
MDVPLASASASRSSVTNRSGHVRHRGSERQQRKPGGVDIDGGKTSPW